MNLLKVKSQKVAASEILSSLPTLCDRIPVPAAGTRKLSKNVLELHEGDWRPIELVCTGKRP